MTREDVFFLLNIRRHRHQRTESHLVSYIQSLDSEKDGDRIQKTQQFLEKLRNLPVNEGYINSDSSSEA